MTPSSTQCASGLGLRGKLQVLELRALAVSGSWFVGASFPLFSNSGAFSFGVEDSSCLLISEAPVVLKFQSPDNPKSPTGSFANHMGSPSTSMGRTTSARLCAVKGCWVTMYVCMDICMFHIVLYCFFMLYYITLY